MTTEAVLPTRGQLERQLSQRLQSLYRQQFGHLPSKVTCHMFANHIAIIAENTVTGIEQFLVNHARLDLAENLRTAINRDFILVAKRAIETIIGIPVIDIMSDSALNTGYLGMVVLLENPPQVRLPKAKIRRNKKLNLETSPRSDGVNLDNSVSSNQSDDLTESGANCD